MTKYLVTGSAGFIGFHVARALLERGDEVIGLDNLNPYYSVKLKEDRNEILKKDPNYTFYKCDLADRGELTRILDTEQPPIICHLAAQAGIRYSFKDPYTYVNSNIVGFLNLIEWAKKKDRVENFVYASSSSVYWGSNKIPFAEPDRVDGPISLYAATKKADELIAHVYHHNFELPVTGLRFFTVYGSWGRPDMAYFSFAQKIMDNETIQIYGQGKMKRDFTYIDDMVPAIIKTLDTPRDYEIYNLGGNQPVELMYFISLIEKELGKDAKKEFLDIQPGEVWETYANIDKAKRELGFDPKTSIEGGIKRFVEWFKEYYNK
jgi:UDP-glucuronate 4-epimerase